MRVALAFFLFSTLLLYTLAQNCQNPLLQLYDIPGLSSPISGKDLYYCKNLRTGQTCCSAEVVKGFQAQVNALKYKLERVGGTRDLYNLQLHEQYLQQFLDLLQTLSKYSNNINKIQNQDNDIGNKLSEQVALFQSIANDVKSLKDNFVNAMLKYQKARATCFTTVMKVEASAWCLACDPNYKSKGVQTDGTIVFSDNLCTTISQSCYDFIIQSEAFNPYIMMRQAIGRLDSINKYLETYVKNADTIPGYVIENDYLQTTNATEKTISVPSSDCTNVGNCPWQCQNLLTNGLLNEIIIGNGAGALGEEDLNLESIGTTSGAHATASPSVNRMRILASGNVWAPNLDETGLVIKADSDPAGVSGFFTMEGSDSSDSDGDETPNSKRRYINSGANLMITTASVLSISFVMIIGAGYI